MRNKLVKYRNTNQAYVHYILDLNGAIASWALSFRCDNKYGECGGSHGWNTHFYTRNKYRRMGLATKLVKEARNFIAKKEHRTTKFHPHDGRSRAFFSHVEPNP